MAEWTYRFIFSWPLHCWRWMVSSTSRPLYPRVNGPRYPLDRRLCECQSRPGQHGEQKNLTPPGLELRPFGRPARSQSLYRLSYPGSFHSGVELFILYLNQIICNYFWDCTRGTRTYIMRVTQNANKNKITALPLRHKQLLHALSLWGSLFLA
jgi:hypothetical protein